MGLALAKECYIRGADLTLLVANVSVDIPSVFKVIHVETSREMTEEVLKLIPTQDIYISAAAVSDFEFEKKSDKKIDSSTSLTLNLKPTKKIIRQIKKINPDIFLVGFKAEFNITREEIIELARKQIRDSGCDLVVANDISKENCHFGSDLNEVLIVSSDVIALPLAGKNEIAREIFNVISDKCNK